MPRNDSKTPFSARLKTGTLALLRRRADQVGTPQTALVERYLEEGLRMDDHPLISFRDGAAGRRPCLVGTRLDVWQVIETVRQNDNDVAAAADYLELPRHRVEACVDYYAEYRDEIDEWTARAHDEAERSEIAWRRRQAIFS